MAKSDDLSHLLRSITDPIVCAKCADDVTSGRAAGASMRDYALLEAGFTTRGLQIWCRRHDLNVVHLDFDGDRPHADFRCLERRLNS